MVKNGKLKYQSLFLLSERKKDSVMVIHGGTLFDYHFSLDEEMSGSQRTSVVLSEYLKGLLSLISTENEDVLLRGTSYIVTERTANKVGLKVVKTDVMQMLILAFNYFNLLASLSKIKKKLEFPKLSRVLTYEGKVSEVKKKEKYIREMIQKIDKPLAVGSE